MSRSGMIQHRTVCVVVTVVVCRHWQFCGTRLHWF